MGAFDVRDLIKADSAGPAQEGTPTSGATRAFHPLAERIAAMPVKRTLSPVLIEGLVRLADFVVVVGVGGLIFWLYVAGKVENALPYQVTIPLLAVGALAAFQALHLYHIGALRNFVTMAVRIIAGWTVLFLLALAAFFFLKIGDQVSRVWLASFYAGGLALLLAERLAVTMIVLRLTRLGRLERRTAIVGGGPAGEELIKALEAQRDTGLRVCGVFDDRNDDRSPDLVAGYPKLGTIDDLVEFARRTKLDLVIFTLPISAEARLLTMLRKLWVLPIDIRLSAHMSKLRFRPRSYSYIGAVPVLDVFDRPIADWDIVVKWLFDKIVGTLALILLSPLMLATAIAIKLDSKGPILFRQKRYGFNNELIEVLKFRSLYHEMSDFAAAKQVTKDDPRVTRVGRFIRKTSIDELPQLFNVVFKGNLSLVGPRPHAIHATASNRAYEQVVDGYFARHKVKPGITGWAQINGWRGETDTEDKIQRRVEHDLYYIENWSVLLDLYILIKTPFSLLTKNENAY
ncbi:MULTISPECIES: undecaprenyl-phosphate glucose phosphotransferase [Bosea]|jgi:Undecaprenyl-phosphate glucose phosphotransferase|uniref:Undecaprenyl-phosphate glucose phosphotransferase n=1 Tax=Bosea rubneri TaxID=3075434 RepID=A0ABU3S5J3_9HYPH|nr:MULTISPECIES: undecaprenyl-phosphate glucose phosphotransferase [unclassified Bosea (in: a-proteobacteria)]MDU0340048.1 undecaprenyl-phosphate glucose phosphotransferase [Bosea sp. ZW T0_25]HEV7338740.1 undecaprenyl-phosphate glucose phosphotransferase [Bosea sp. (in: a-proteobacteria)]